MCVTRPFVGIMFSSLRRFIDHKISGDILCVLDANGFKSLGVSSLGQRLAILKAVYQLKVANGVEIRPGDYVPPCT